MAEQHSVVTTIARPYAAALFDLAKGENALDSVAADLAEVKALATDSDDFARFLRSPVIGAEAKAAAVDAILAGSAANPTVANFLKLVARNGRLFALPAMIDGFTRLVAEARGETSAEVTSAAPLTDAQRQALVEALTHKLGKSVTLLEHVDASLIGGLVVKAGSQMIDSSLKTKLQAMKIAMKEVG